MGYAVKFNSCVITRPLEAYSRPSRKLDWIKSSNLFLRLTYKGKADKTYAHE